MTWRFNSPPGWPLAPADFVPPPGWQPDPTWPPAPREWNFWIDEADPVPDARQLTADDGTAVLGDSTLTFRFDASHWKSPFKAAIGVRTYPLDAIGEVSFQAPGSIRNGFVSVRVKPGRDVLRQFLKDDSPSAGSDPDCLVVAPAQAALAELFVARLRDTVARAAPGEAMVSTGTLPIEVKGADGTAGFDGRHLTLEFGGWTADQAKKRLGRRALPVSSILRVQIRHPGMSGWIRFAPVDAPPEPNPSPAKDPHTLCLNADNASRYVVLAAAVTQCLPRPDDLATSAADEPKRPAPPLRATPVTAKNPPASPRPGHLPYGLPDTVHLDAESRLIQVSGLNLVRLASLGSTIGVVGESRYQRALRKIAGGRAVASGSVDDAIPAIAVLVPEPHNPHDSAAVRIDLLDTKGLPRTVGYLDRYWAAECHGDLARLNVRHGYCQARITGGGRERHYGVFLHWHPSLSQPVANRQTTGYLLEGDRRVTVTKEAQHQDVLSRYAPRHVDDRTIVLAELAFTTVRSGKYADRTTIEVRFDGSRVGETTRHQAQKYEALVTEILDRGVPPVCESIVRRKVGLLEVELLLPSRF